MTNDKAKIEKEETITLNSIPDRVYKEVKDDHASNEVLHNTLQAIHSTNENIVINLMSDKEERKYMVYVKSINSGIGQPTLPHGVHRLIERDKARIISIVSCSDDHIKVAIRPVETKVEPVEIPVEEVKRELE